MPEWISHILIALIAAELFNIKKKSLLVLGSLLPDFMGKIYLLNYFITLPLWLTLAPFMFHFYIPAVIVAMMTAYLFRHFLRALIVIPLGATLHILADNTTRHFFNRNDWYRFLWEDQYWIVIIVTGIIYLLILWLKNRGGTKDEIKKDT